MWKCHHCKAEIEDKYRHCWNCGKAKAADDQPLHYEVTPPLNDEPLKVESLNYEPPTAAEARAEDDFLLPKEVSSKQEFLFERESPSGGKPSSKIKMWLAFGVWLIAFLLTLGFTYFSHQRMEAFSRLNSEDARNLNDQKDQFVFPKNASTEKNSVSGGMVKQKILPLSSENNEVNRSLFSYLPDDLRPANLEEVKTILWIDCKSSEFGRYTDDTIAYRDKCNAYLVDRDTSKVIAVQDFLGEVPPLSKKSGDSDTYGKVLPEEYISFIRSKQPENERTAEKFSSDSANYSFFSKSELYYSVLLLFLLGAIGFGWIAYKLKFSDLDMD